MREVIDTIDVKLIPRERFHKQAESYNDAGDGD